MLTDPLALSHAVVAGAGAGSARGGTQPWQCEIACAEMVLPQVSCALGVKMWLVIDTRTSPLWW